MWGYFARFYAYCGTSGIFPQVEIKTFTVFMDNCEDVAPIDTLKNNTLFEELEWLFIKLINDRV